MRTRIMTAGGLLPDGDHGSNLSAGEGEKRMWTFDDDEPGMIAKGFTNEVGEWKVVDTPEGKVLCADRKEPRLRFQRRSGQ